MIKYILILFLYILLIFPVNASKKLPINIKKYFGNFKGCFVIKNISKGDIKVYNDIQCKKRWKPCSTFKIPNSLIGLETGIVTPTTIIKWSGIKYSFKSWEQDHNLRTAIKYSVIPFYKEIARRIGLSRMQEYVTKINYGNNKIGVIVDNFWLDGPLMINAYEQLTFMESFYKNKLPFNKKNLEYVKEILIQKNDVGKIISGKTGSDIENNKTIWGWFVGHLKTMNTEYVFVINIQGEDKAWGWKAKKISFNIIDYLKKGNLL